MDQGDRIRATPQLDCGAWSDFLFDCGARFNPQGIGSDFAGFGRRTSLCGFTVIELVANAPRVERTDHDVRHDGADHYCVLFVLAGRPVGVIHNDRTALIAAGDVVLGDSALPATLLAERAGEWWHLLALKLPRQALIAHLGFEPRGGLHRPRGTPAARLLLDLVRGHDDPAAQASSPADSYMQLVIYDLVGALFAPPDPWAASRHTDKLFARVRSLIEARLADPDFGPADVAAEAGISLRYVQKLFTQHGATCSEFIYGLRLERAARLLRRRASLRSGQPLAEIAYACGFRDYTHFARKFRARFGCPPGASRFLHQMNERRGSPRQARA